MKQVKEIADRYLFDSWFVDEYFFHRSLVCYNPFCMEKWKERTGTDLPKPLPDAKFPQYLDFMVETYRSFYQQIKDQLKASKRQVITTHNFGLDYTHDDYLIMESNPNGFDFYQMSARAKFYRAQAAGRELQMIPHRGNAYTDGTNAPLPHLIWQTAVAISHNAAVMWADQSNVDGTLDATGIRAVKEAFRVADRLIPKVRGTVPYAEVAILFSERDVELSSYENYLDYYGAHKLLTDLHWPFDVVTAEQLNPSDLAKFRVLLIPRLQYLSLDHYQKLLQYLESGGNILFCDHCAVYDAAGQPHATPHLGLVKVQETNEPRAYVKLLFPIDDERLKAAQILTVEPTVGHQVLGTLIRPSIHRSESSSFIDAPYPGKLTDQPVMVRARQGKGWFVYFGYRFFQEYLNQNLTVFGQVLERVVKDFYQPDLWVQAPTVVEAIYNQSGKELRVSLINSITSRPSGGHMFAERGQRGHINILEVIPISDLAICVRNLGVQRATNLARKQLSILRQDDYVAVRVPRLEQYDLITLHLR